MRVVPGIMVMAAMMGLAGAAQAEVMSVGDDEGYCREYTQTLRIGGKLRQGYGTACLQPDGSWQLVSPAQTAAEDEVVFDAGAYEIGGEPVQYVVESPQVVMLPPAPVVWGDVWIGGDFGHRHHGRHGGRHWHR